MDSFFLVLFIIFIGFLGRRRAKRLERRLAELRERLDGVLAEIQEIKGEAIKGETPASLPAEMRGPVIAAASLATLATPPVTLGSAESPEAARPVEAPHDEAVTAPVVAEPVERVTPPDSVAPTAAPEIVFEPPPPRKSRSLEERLGAHWTVWIGGLALALGAVLLVRYSIESGFFGPGMRVALGALLAALLVGAGEFLRRRDVAERVVRATDAPVGDASAGAPFAAAEAGPFASPYIPGVLTAAGTVAAFATIYAAHAVYGFIGPAVAFLTLGVVALAAMAAAALHGPALAGLGLVGALATPLLVVSQTPSLWPVIAYDLVVVAAAYALARTKHWLWLALAAAVGAGLWAFAFVALIENATDDGNLRAALTHIVLQAALAAYALAFDAHRGRPDRHAYIDPVANGVLAGFAFLAMLALAVAAPAHFGTSWIVGTLAMAAVLTLAGVAAAPAAGAVALGGLVILAALCLWPGLLDDIAASVDRARQMRGFTDAPVWALALADGVRPVWRVWFATFAVGGSLAVALASGARLLAGAALPMRVAGAYAGTAAIAPLAALAIAYLRLSGHQASPRFALMALLLGAGFAGAALVFGRSWRADPEPAPKLGLGAMAASAIAAIALGLVFGLDRGMLTVGLALAAAGTAYVAMRLELDALRWCVAALGVLVAARLAYEPRIVGSALSATPVFNWLLFGYGVPAASFALAGRLLRRGRDDIPADVADALAVLFSALLFFFEIRHALNGGDPFARGSGLVEQGLFAVTSLGFSLVLTRLDAGRCNLVFRYASIALGALGVVIAAGGLLLWHDPLLRTKPVEGGPALNALSLGYLLPAVMASVLAISARKGRPFWYWGIAGWLAVLLGLAFLILEVRVLFHGQMIVASLGAGIAELGIDAVICLGAAALLVRRARALSTLPPAEGSGASATDIFFAVAAFGAGGMGFGIAVIGLGLFYNPFFDATPIEGGLVFNALIPGYLLPSLAAAALAVSARKAHATWYWAGLVGLGVALGLAYLIFEVRVLFHGQVIVADLGAGIAELGIDTAIFLGLAILVSLPIGRQLLSWREEASMGFAAIGALIFVVGLCVFASPLMGEAKVVGGAVLNTLLVGYALPCLGAAVLARRARVSGWLRYASLASIGAILALFAYASLEVRYIFRGEEMDLLQGFTQSELYAYSATWLTLGILLLAYGLWRGSREARFASACFVVVSALKVFLVDLAGLEGILRALSFIGLGAVLIGIGLVYQKFVFAKGSSDVARDLHETPRDPAAPG